MAKQHRCMKWFVMQKKHLSGIAKSEKQTRDIFRGAYDYLEAGQIYEAVNKAAVFGGMGSWNDDPAGLAYEKGLESEYNELSNRLLEQVRYHVMYAANELY